MVIMTTRAIRRRLWAATGRYTDFVAKLVDVHPDGTAINVAEGILRARFHRGLDKMELLEANRRYEFTIDRRGTANVFLPGHRTRIVQSGDGRRSRRVRPVADGAADGLRRRRGAVAPPAAAGKSG
jgi:predicted acyl esterase